MITKISLRTQRKLNTILWFICILFCAGLVLIPATWMVISSMKPNYEQFSIPFVWFSKHLTLEAYRNVLADPSFLQSCTNSYIVSIGTTILTVSLSTLAAYGFSRFRFFGRTALLVYALASQMFPHALLVIPYFFILQRLGLYDTYLGLIISYCAFCLPLCMWMLWNYFDTIPISLDEAALIDGCSRIKIIFGVIVPLATPGILATAAFSFLYAWNNFLFALCLTGSDKMRPLTVLIAGLVGEYTTQWNELMAMAFFQSVPLIIVFVFLQKYVVSGITAGAVKQ